MLRIYRRLWQVNWAEQWQYRANLLMYLLYWLVSPIVYLAVWTTVAAHQGSVNGLTANDFITYYMVLLIVDQMTSETTIYILAYKIQDGTLSGDLVKPVHPILTNTLVNNLAFKVLTFMVMIPVWLVLLLLFKPNFSGVTWQAVLLAIPAMVMGFVISFLLGATLTCLAFWTTRLFYSGVLLYPAYVVFGAIRPADLDAEVRPGPGPIFAFSAQVIFSNPTDPGQATAGDDHPKFCVGLGLAAGCLWLVQPGMAGGSSDFRR